VATLRVFLLLSAYFLVRKDVATFVSDVAQKSHSNLFDVFDISKA